MTPLLSVMFIDMLILWLRADEYFKCFAVGHGLVAGRDVVQADGAVEDLAGFDGAVEHEGQQLLDVGPGRCDAAGERDVAHELSEPERNVGVLRCSDAADDAAVADDTDRHLDRRAGPTA